MLAWAYRAAPLFWERYSADRKRAILDPSGRPRPSQWNDSGIHAAWIGHSTVLLKIDGTTILTDPVFSARIGLESGTPHARRQTPGRAGAGDFGHCPKSIWCCFPTRTSITSISPAFARWRIAPPR